MRNRVLAFITLVLFLPVLLAAAAKEHVIAFGKWQPVKLFVGPLEDRAIDMKIRPLYIDGRLREFTTGNPYDVTDRQFVVRRAYRLNDWLPADVDDAAALPPGKRTGHHFKWQRGGWLLVDRANGRITQLRLPDFDPFYSVASWYRDYAAYCGISDDGEKLYAVVVQLGRKKPLVHKLLRPASGAEMPDSECAAPEWQRKPVRVSFQPSGGEPIVFSIRGHAADVAAAETPEESDD